MKFTTSILFCFGSLSSTLALSIAEINGPAFISPYKDQTVANVTGLVTAVGSSGFYLRDLPSVKKPKKLDGSSAIYVYGSSSAKQVAVGDVITLSGKVEEYRSNDLYIPLTEITGARDILKVSSGNTVEPIDLSKLKIPTEQYSKLDDGNIFGVPNNQALISVVNATLEPKKYGLDFWESLVGELVYVKDPAALGKTSNYGDVWVRSKSWKATGLNKRGGLTISASGNDKKTDANPEAIVIGSPALDNTRNPSNIKLGDTLGPLTGVVTYAFGFYRIIPTTALTVTNSATSDYPATSLKSSGSCSGLSVGQYNVENLTPKSAHIPGIASHIVNKLNSPDLLFLQEVQDNDGTTNSGTVSANETLSTLISAIAEAGGVTYNFVDISPSNNQDGGAPGGNIRVSYLYNPSILSLRNPNPGDATTAITVSKGLKGVPELSLNPGRIAPAEAAWTASRKPLVAAFNVKGSSSPLFTINVHFGSKGGSSSTQGDARPPINGGVEDRLAQATLLKNFVNDITAIDANAKIIAAGDFNEFPFVAPMLVIEDNKFRNIDEVAGIKEEERYSYGYDGNCQQLDNMFVSKGVWKGRGVRAYEHVHVNTWAGNEQVSDHDPAVGILDVC
ncbi:endonuclease/exonuclease/phosphatase family protein [Ascodesmis nigricans]|uniref:Endonuclease/exonuclease/phosphatase family protein n=1 Tax=Ascodesmis nigricans TaxID=341454 RepID=A0A4S2MLK5_9PEZI|nr:endonuclease/exonuclease/phosphatase family protein [Ascodesmis nigricans]